MNDNKTLSTRLLAWLKQEQVWGFMVSVTIMAIVSVGYFMPDNFEGNHLSQNDMVQGAANGEEGRAYEEATGEKALWTNSLFSGMPTFQISPSYDSNSLFDWLNSVYGLGLPAPSNLLFMMMMGMLIMLYCWRLRWWYALVGALAWGLSSYFIIIVGAGHIWKFMALTYVPPTIGALALAYRGRYLSGAALMGIMSMLELNANHPQITYYSTFIMLALVIGWLVQAIRQHKMKQWLTASAVCLGAGLLGLAANAPSLYNTYEYAKETKRSASELTPVVNPEDEGKLTEKPTGGLPRAEICGWSNTPSETFTLLIPNLKGGASGRLTEGQMQREGLDKIAKESDSYESNDQVVDYILSTMPQYFGGKMDSGGTNGPFYVGVLIFALFILGCCIVKGPEVWALLTVTIIAVLLAMGSHLQGFTDLFIDYVPMYNKFRAAETILIIVCLTMPLVGMLGLQKLLSTPDAFKVYRKEVILSLGIPAFLCMILWMAPSFLGDPVHERADNPDNVLAQAAQPYIMAYQYGQISEADVRQTLTVIEQSVPDAIKAARELRGEMISADAGRSLLILLLGGGIIVLGAMGRVRRVAVVASVGVITTFDLWSVDKRYVASDSFVKDVMTFNDPLAPDEIDKAISADKGYYRVLDMDNPGGAARSFHHHMVTGYHAAKLNRYNDLIDRGMLTKGRVLDMLNTRYFIQGGQVIPNESALGPAWLVDSLKWVDKADDEFNALETIDPESVAVADKKFQEVLGTNCPSRVPGDTVVMTSYNPNTVSYKVTTAKGGVVVFSEVWFPWGWKATIDGKPAELGRVNYVLRAMKIPAGTHEVSMTFDPDSIHVTTNMAYGAVTLIYLLVLGYLFTLLCPGLIPLSKDRAKPSDKAACKNDDNSSEK